MFTFFHTIILGIVEGITEFLPVSSTGHLVLTSHFLHIPQTDFLKNFEITIQLGAILAVVVLYARTVFLNKAVIKRIIIACVPTFIVGALLYTFVKHYLLGNIYLVAATLFLGGIVLVVFELFHKEKIEKTERLEDVSYKHAFFIGLAQAAAIIPGISRSAATIIGAISLKHQRKTAVEFSFLLAVPTMAAAVGLDVVKSYKNFSLDHLGLLLVGFVVSFITALIAVKFLLKFIQRNTFLVFGVYRILIAAVLFFVIY